MAKRTHDPTATHGVAIVRELVVGSMGWIFREQYESDYGIDAQVEVVDSNGKPTGKVIALQIKTGPSYFKEKTFIGYVHRPSTDHVRYWRNHSLPVIIVLVDRKAKHCYWELVDSATIVQGATRCKMVIPRHKLLTADSKLEIEEIVSQHRYSPALVRLSLAKPLMRAAAEGNLWLEGERWINKSSGRSALKFLRIVKTKESIVLEWPYIIAPSASFTEMVIESFPWATFEVDADLYERYEEQMWEEETAVYFEGEIFHHENTFEEWQELRNRQGLREYMIEADLVARYRFKVGLSDLGKAFLVVEDHVSAEAL